MSILFSALGTIFGTIYFAIGNNTVLVIALVSFIVSSVTVTTLRHRRIEIISFLTCLLFCFFNYNIRSEYLEFKDLSQYIKENQSAIHFQISSTPKDKIFNTEFIVDIKKNQKNFIDQIQETFLPLRFISSSPSTLGLEEGDIIEIKGEYNFEKLQGFDYQVNKKNKCFYELKKAQISFKASQENFFTKTQKSIKEFFYSHLEPENAAITSSLLIGAKTASPPERFTKISYKLGIGHFLAASGFQLVVLGFLVNFVLKAFKINFILTNSITIILVLIYAGLAGFSPSITRAAICTVVFLLLQFLKRKPESKRFITILAGIVLFLDPYTIFDLGFQFSYLATLAILCWTKTIENKLEFIKPSFIKEAIAITLSVQFFLLPLSIYYFGNLQIWSIFANIFLTPILTLITLLAFFGLTPIIEPLLNFTKYIIYSCEKLPLLDSNIETNLTSTLLFTLLLNILGFIIFKPNIEVPSDKDFFKNIYTRYYDENIFLFLKKIFTNSYMQIALLISSLALLLATNLNPPNINSFRIENGLIVNLPELKQVIKDKETNYKYIDYQGTRILIIKKRSSLKQLGTLLDDLREVDILLLPKLNNQDIYLNTLIEICKPQFIVCSITKQNTNAKTKNQADENKVQKNLEIITSKAHTIIDSGVIYISKERFWNISKS